MRRVYGGAMIASKGLFNMRQAGIQNLVIAIQREEIR
jgi:hypothetical protein